MESTIASEVAIIEKFQAYIAETFLFDQDGDDLATENTDIAHRCAVVIHNRAALE